MLNVLIITHNYMKIFMTGQLASCYKSQVGVWLTQ